MKVPVSWLREYVDFDLPVEELARRLVFTSCEVDRVVHRGVPGGANYEHFVVGKVVEADKHPNADKLQLTRVDVGGGESRSIVCGAWNFGVGATVAVVLPGGVMPGGDLTIDPVTGDTLCLAGTIDLTRGSGQSKFQIAPSSLFDASLADILWTVETNTNFRIAQFRVYSWP